MSRPELETLAIIVAMTEPAPPAFAARLARFSEQAGPFGEVFVVDASGTLSVEWLARRFANVRVLYRPTGQLAPRLWRDGLVRTEAALIAFTTAHMLLSPGWRDALIGRMVETNASGVGGPIEPGLALSGIDRAVVLLRYSNYFPPLPASGRVEPPGDNALYRRDRLLEVKTAWADGFWEVDVHQALRDRGETLATTDQAVATFEGGSTLRAMVRQRVRHAIRYGAVRSRGSAAFPRILRVIASPLVPPLLCHRIVRNLRSRRIRLTPWIAALPGLLILATAWAAGEAVGTWRGSAALSDVNP